MAEGFIVGKLDAVFGWLAHRADRLERCIDSVQNPRATKCPSISHPYHLMRAFRYNHHLPCVAGCVFTFAKVVRSFGEGAGMNGFDFSDAMVVVTGAAAGLGLGIARAFHAAGARVALGDLRKELVESVAGRLGGERVFADALDVRDEHSVQAFFAAAQASLGAVTIAVANAGVLPNCPVLDMPLEEWDRVMQTNLRGTFLTCRTAARSMVADERPGKIITMSSGAAGSGRLGAAHYAASKAGIVMFTRVLAMELAARRINVNAIAPGYIDTNPDRPAAASPFQEAMLSNIPWGRMGTPADVAQAAMFLASPAADYVTGEVLAVNGGAFAGRMYLPLGSPRARPEL